MLESFDGKEGVFSILVLKGDHVQPNNDQGQGCNAAYGNSSILGQFLNLPHCFGKPGPTSWTLHSSSLLAAVSQ